MLLKERQWQTVYINSSLYLIENFNRLGVEGTRRLATSRQLYDNFSKITISDFTSQLTQADSICIFYVADVKSIYFLSTG